MFFNILLMLLVILLKVLAGIAVSLAGVGAEYLAYVCLRESGEPEAKGGDLVVYGLGWVVGLIGGIILFIMGIGMAVAALGGAW